MTQTKDRNAELATAMEAARGYRPAWAVDSDEPFVFDVTCVLGQVTVHPDGLGPSPHVAAFSIIAEHDAPGDYSFPMADGRTCRVTVEYDGHA